MYIYICLSFLDVLVTPSPTYGLLRNIFQNIGMPFLKNKREICRWCQSFVDMLSLFVNIWWCLSMFVNIRHCVRTNLPTYLPTYLHLLSWRAHTCCLSQGHVSGEGTWWWCYTWKATRSLLDVVHANRGRLSPRDRCNSPQLTKLDRVPSSLDVLCDRQS